MDDRPVKVYLQSTIPVTCKEAGYNGKCEITFPLVTPSRLVIAQANNMQAQDSYLQCMYRISRESWKPNEGLAYNNSEPLEIMVRRQPSKQGTTTQVIKFMPLVKTTVVYTEMKDGTRVAAHSIFDNYQIENIIVSDEYDV